jgi:hypothetical protein
MHRIAIGVTSIVLVFGAGAYAQNVTSRVTGAVGTVGSVAGGAPASALGASGSGLGNPVSDLPGNSQVGGVLPGAFGIKAGDRVIQFRGAASVGEDRNNFKAGLGIPF